MLKKIVHVFFLITGGTLGFLYMPTLFRISNMTDVGCVHSSYLVSVLGTFFFIYLYYFFSYFVVFYLYLFLVYYYIVEFLKCIEEGLNKVLVIDLFFGSIGLILGLVIAYLITIPLQDIGLRIVSEIVPLFLTIIIGYLGFQVGFRRREEFMNLLTITRKERARKQEEEDQDEKLGNSSSEVKPKILDTSVIIDGRIADICQTNFLEGTVI